MPKFIKGNWCNEIDVRDFIQLNYRSYTHDSSFLAGPTNKTKKLWEAVKLLVEKERKKGILDLDTENPASITSHKPGYIDKRLEVIYGLQTDAPLKRSIKPNGGIKLVEDAAASYGYKIPKEVSDIYYKYRKTHNDGVFSAYTDIQKLLRSKKILTGLPDNYGRGRIIGDYRRAALYGVDRLIADKIEFLSNISSDMSDDLINIREEINTQINALNDLKQMALSYGFDISKPATDSREAIQWIYFAYLAAVKEQDGAAMSLGRLDAFLDTYINYDLEHKKYSEEEVQEMIDQFVIKLRIVRHLRHPEYNELFAGDPTWITLVLGGTGLDGRSMVTKTSFRFLNTLTNLGPAPEPNLTILWGRGLPKPWKEYCSKMSIESSSIQYENDDLMKPYYGDDYAIACCVSGMSLGKEMQYFGARCNLAKLLLLAINGGKEEPLAHLKEKNNGGDLIINGVKDLKHREILNYEEVYTNFLVLMDWLAKEYVNTMNVIHFMHDKYHYEGLEMALHDSVVKRYMAFGIAGLSVVVDSLSAIKYAKVKPSWNSKGVASNYKIQGEYPSFGNDDDRVDSIAKEVTKQFYKSLAKHQTHRNAIHTLSILTITSNVVYGKSTGATPDGRESGVPFAPGANPMHGRDRSGAIASLNSVAKISYQHCQDGISNTFSIVPSSLGKEDAQKQKNLVQLLDGYFIGKGGHHLNVNVLDQKMLKDAQKHPEKYPQLTIRVSGYAVLFSKLSKEQQDEVIARTFHSTF